jgi:hypothetical protein
MSKSRFCYNYKAPGFIQPCCKPVVCASSTYLNAIASTPSIVNGETRTTQGSLLAAKQQSVLQDANQASITSTIQYTQQNAAAISAQIQGQLDQLTVKRYVPYQPYIYPVVPVSVMQLQMATANVGVPMSFFTAMDCKGNQFVTT